MRKDSDYARTAGMRYVDLGRAARETIEAMRRHSELVLADRPAAEVTEAAEALARALYDYNAAVINHDSPGLKELEECADSLTTDRSERPASKPPPAGTRMSVWWRSDFIVLDPERLLAVGRDCWHQERPDDRPDEVEFHVPDLVAAVEQMLHHEDLEPLRSFREQAVVKPVGASTEVYLIRQSYADTWPEGQEDTFDRANIIGDD